MGTHLQTQVHIAQTNEFTEFEVNKLSCQTVDKPALAIMPRLEI